jgi:hypothetical protein
MGVIIKKLAHRLAHISELVSQNFDYIGFCNASTLAGGVWFNGNKALPPLVWQVEFLPDIRREVISEQSPEVQLTNSDLEMAGVVLHFLVLEDLVPKLTHCQAVIGCDNSPAVAWTWRMTTWASSPMAH